MQNARLTHAKCKANSYKTQDYKHYFAYYLTTFVFRTSNKIAVFRAKTSLKSGFLAKKWCFWDGENREKASK